MSTLNKRLIALVFGLTVLANQSALADGAITTAHSSIEQNQVQPLLFTQVQFKKLTDKRQQAFASKWGVSRKEYSHYLWLMHNTPSGKWYANLDPAEVLAINAKDDNERMHFATIIAKNTYHRLNGELKMQRAYEQAFHRLYPDLQPINKQAVFHQTQTGLHLQSGDKLLLFTRLNNLGGDALVSRLVVVLAKQSQVSLHVFITDKSATDQQIRNWAKNAGIPAKLVLNRVITLNHDNGRLEKMVSVQANLPLVVLDRNRRFTIINIQSLWS